MDFTGFTRRFFTDSQNISFLFENLQTDAIEIFTGGYPNGASGKEVRIGFSGIHANTGWYFAFRNGKIYDPEGRFVYSYTQDDTFNFSGNISTGNYDYYINEDLICSVGLKSGFNINAWFISCISGASGSANVYVNGPTIPVSLSFPTSFTSGGLWSGNFSHTNVGPIVIRSGELRMTDANQFSISGTGLSYNNGTNVVNTGASRAVGLIHTGIASRTGLYVVGVRIYTDFGPADFVISGTGLPPSNSIISNNLYPDTTGALIATGSGVTGTKYWYYHTVATDLSGNPLTKPIYLELSYLSGITGLFSRVTGVNITSTGVSYSSAPLFFILPTGSGSPVSFGVALLNSSSGVTGVSFLSTGYYPGPTGSYTVLFSGGGGSFASGTPRFDSGYTKSFSGRFQFYTGVFSSGNAGVACANNATTFSGSTTLTTGETLVFMKINYVAQADSAPLWYRVRASGLADSITSVTVYSGSGVVFRG